MLRRLVEILTRIIPSCSICWESWLRNCCYDEKLLPLLIFHFSGTLCWGFLEILSRFTFFPFTQKQPSIQQRLVFSYRKDIISVVWQFVALHPKTQQEDGAGKEITGSTAWMCLLYGALPVTSLQSRLPLVDVIVARHLQTQHVTEEVRTWRV